MSEPTSLSRSSFYYYYYHFFFPPRWQHKACARDKSTKKGRKHSETRHRKQEKDMEPKTGTGKRLSQHWRTLSSSLHRPALAAAAIKMVYGRARRPAPPRRRPARRRAASRIRTDSAMVEEHGSM